MVTAQERRRINSEMNDHIDLGSYDSLEARINNKYGKYVSRRRNIKLYTIIKRFFDIFVSLVTLVLFLPVFAVSALLIKIDSKGPVIFKQNRIGRRKNVFKLYKLRTMYIDAPPFEATMDLEYYYQYITKIGYFLRKSSLDEFPQFFNTLMGDMTLIGPRPVIGSETRLIEERDKRGVYGMKPGITGLAQINGRDYVDPVSKAIYDGYYAENFCFRLDMHIFFSSFVSILRSKDIH
jgi:O-antigen biosynthesis protein WbqP